MIGLTREMSVNDALTRTSARWERLGRRNPMWAALTNRTWREEDFLRDGAVEVEKLLEELAALGAAPTLGTALDFGCGPGRLSAGLAGAGFSRVIGVDVSAAMLTAARRLVQHSACEFVYNDRADLSRFETNSVDFIYSARVLQHMPTELSHNYIREFFRVARPDATVAFQLPTRPARGLRGLPLRLVPAPVLTVARKGMQMHGTRQNVVEKIARQAGWNVIRAVPDRAAGPRWESVTYICRSAQED
jgi:SAM-dependent methyltransferase